MKWESGAIVQFGQFSLDPLWKDIGIPLAMMGVVVVFVALGMVIVLINTLPRVLERLNLIDSAQTPSGLVESLSVSTDDEIPPETLVVIAAAVEEMMRHPYRIVRIKGMSANNMGWVMAARMQHHHSHKMQRPSS